MTLKGIAKKALAPVVFHVARTFIRFSPSPVGKTWVWDHLWSRLAGQNIPERVVTTVFGLKMVVQPPDAIQTMILLTGRWEPQISRYLEARLRPGDIFIDVGANIGHHTLLAAHLVGPTGRVYAFEASPSIYRKLVRNIELNDASNIVVTNKAVASKPGKLDFWLASDKNLGHSTTVSQLASDEGMRLEAQVDADTLEHLLPADVLSRARVIKIDVEGAERDVLEPLAAQMSKFSDDTEWLLELAPAFAKSGQSDVDWIFQLFQRNGYHAYAIPNPYTLTFYIEPVGATPVTRLDAPPTDRLVDVLYSKRVLTEI